MFSPGQSDYTDSTQKVLQGPGVGNEKDGYFSADSIIRRMTSEAAVLLGGGYAVLLQLAHPFIAAGVDDHSQFQSDILTRLFRTVYFVHSMVFDEHGKVNESLDHFHKAHASIRGRLGDRAGKLDQDTVYSGDDPHAKLWVFATLVDSGLKTYEHFIRPLNTRRATGILPREPDPGASTADSRRDHTMYID